MKRFFGALLLAAGIAVAAGACDDSSGGGYGYYGRGASSADCSTYTACGTCTPVNGCGWCFAPASAGGGGACTNGPDACVSESGEFTWTWNASGCPGVDASVGPASDAGATSASEASLPPADAGSAVSDAGSTATSEASAADAPVGD